MRLSVLLIVLLVLAGCGSRHARSEEIQPEGLVIERGAVFYVRAEGLEEHALYVAQLEHDVAQRLVLAGWKHASGREDLDVLILIDWLEPGDERGTLAECRVTVHVARGGSEWRFTAYGDSAGRWKKDRIPTAVGNTAKAVAERLLTTQKD